ncbi:class I SAM-dependent methyltransferase [Bacillus inaquosorum]|uniref:class I SAM-dependent methyltransferase n=1 Tax=Bacillus inaquosorum TaxID=483913 RepID=UPI00227DA1D1|nr:class I SAM-dependent methyltransferase [Bacillus inaquosorum]MCY8147023.1 class I SAM-dependent methyltransferase [Bacillus inaquosorum]
MKLKENASENKLRGGYYTPIELARFIAQWGISNSVTNILEPSCGDGNFLEALKNSKTKFKCTAVELVETEATKAKTRVGQDSRFNIINNDFYKEYEKKLKNKKFDFVLGNPPYIRYQYLTEEQREEQSLILTKNGLTPNKLINAWVSFVVAGVQLLDDEGKIGLIIPAELLQVKYSEQLRIYLMRKLQKITIITLRELVFPGVEQDVVLLLGEKSKNHDGEHLIKILQFKNIRELSINFVKENEKTGFKEIDLSTAKWTRYLLNQEQNDAIDQIKKDKGFVSFENIGEVDIGITTGNNKFFSVNKSTVSEYKLENVTLPLIARSVNIPGVNFEYSDWIDNVEADANTFLIDFNDIKDEDFNTEQRRYIQEGEERGENTGYKCRIRRKWYCIPSIWSPDAFFLRRNHIYPKFVLNNLQGAVSTDTMHRIRFTKFTDRRKAILAYYNSIGLAFTELEARSYGGGVLEILPGELEKVTVPYLHNIEIKDSILNSLLEEIDLLFRRNNDISQVLKLVDQKVLIEIMKVPKDIVKTFNEIWITLRNRRLER